MTSLQNFDRLTRSHRPMTTYAGAALLASCSCLYFPQRCQNCQYRCKNCQYPGKAWFRRNTWARPSGAEYFMGFRFPSLTREHANYCGDFSYCDNETGQIDHESMNGMVSISTMPRRGFVTHNNLHVLIVAEHGPPFFFRRLFYAE